MKDSIVLGALLLAFATLVTVHVAIAVRLLSRKEDRWRGALSLVVPPVAPIWALQRGWRRSAVIWVSSVVVYATALIVGLR
ncbi:MAG: hypothetical protein R3B70_23910 [Polyangiaceae bacterium]